MWELTALILPGSTIVFFKFSFFLKLWQDIYPKPWRCWAWLGVELSNRERTNRIAPTVHCRCSQQHWNCREEEFWTKCQKLKELYNFGCKALIGTFERLIRRSKCQRAPQSVRPSKTRTTTSGLSTKFGKWGFRVIKTNLSNFSIISGNTLWTNCSLAPSTPCCCSRSYFFYTKFSNQTQVSKALMEKLL